MSVEDTGVATARRRGRKDKDGAEKVLNYGPLKENAKDLMKLRRRLANAQTDFNDKCKAVAEKCNCNTGSVKSIINASFSGKFADKQREIEQLSLTFSEVGEIANGAVTASDEGADQPKH